MGLDSLCHRNKTQTSVISVKKNLKTQTPIRKSSIFYGNMKSLSQKLKKIRRQYEKAVFFIGPGNLCHRN
jgi:hypothetical protein